MIEHRATRTPSACEGPPATTGSHVPQEGGPLGARSRGRGPATPSPAHPSMRGRAEPEVHVVVLAFRNGYCSRSYFTSRAELAGQVAYLAHAAEVESITIEFGDER